MIIQLKPEDMNEDKGFMSEEDVQGKSSLLFCFMFSSHLRESTYMYR